MWFVPDFLRSHMGIQRSQEDAWTMEMRKWEHRPVLVNGTYIEPLSVAEGGKFNAPHQEYPKTVYKMEAADGGPRVGDYDTVHDASEESRANSRGYFSDQHDAIRRLEAQQLEFATLAANRVYHERLMSAKARAEAAIVDESTMQHLPVIPETPITRRGRKPKTAQE